MSLVEWSKLRGKHPMCCIYCTLIAKSKKTCEKIYFLDPRENETLRLNLIQQRRTTECVIFHIVHFLTVHRAIQLHTREIKIITLL